MKAKIHALIFTSLTSSKKCFVCRVKLYKKLLSWVEYNFMCLSIMLDVIFAMMILHMLHTNFYFLKNLMILFENLHKKLTK